MDVIQEDEGNGTGRVVALASEPVDISGVDDLPSSDTPARLRLTLEGDQATFVGVASEQEAARLLDRTAHERVTSDERAGAFGGELEPTRQDGGALAGPPVVLIDWEASSSASDAATVTWEPTDGRWVIVAMNADGSTGLDVSGRIGFEHESETVVTGGDGSPFLPHGGAR